MFADDFSYSYSWYDGERISGLKDIVLSQYSHYFSWGSRVVCHFLAQFFLWIGKDWFNIINTVGFLVLGILIYYHGTNRRLKDDISLLIFIYCSLFMFTPAFGESFLWVTGSSNYMYGIELILFYLIPYRFVSKKNDKLGKRDNWFVMLIKLAAMLIFGLLAGWTNENTSVGLVAIVLGFLVYYKYNKNKILPWMIGGWIGNIAGCAMHLVSPGNKVRTDVVGKVDFKGVVKNTIFITSDFTKYFSVFIIIFTLITFMYIDSKKDGKMSKQLIEKEAGKLFITIIYTIGFLGSMYSMILSPSFPPRAWSGIFVLLITVILSYYTDVTSKDEVISKYDLKVLKRARIILIGVFVVLCLRAYAGACFTLRNQSIENNIRIAVIENCIEQNQDEAYIPAIGGSSRYSCYSCYGNQGDLSWDENAWLNAAMARYFGIAKIIRDDDIIQ